MCNRMMATGVALAVASLVVAPGCVTNKKFRTNNERTMGRIQEVQSAVETNERRLGTLESETDRKFTELQLGTTRALETGTEARSVAETAAATADRALKGRLLWDETLSDDRVKFGFNRASLSSEAKSMLDQLATNVKTYGKAVYIEIAGYTDNAGDETYNARLSENRASVVREYLNEQGIPLHAMNVIGKGEKDPVADNQTSQGRAKNRRVVVSVLE